MVQVGLQREGREIGSRKRNIPALAVKGAEGSMDMRSVSTFKGLRKAPS